jgi:ATP-dependent DNA ligase
MDLNVKTNYYQGCAEKIEGTETQKMARLVAMEKSGDWIAQPKCDGHWGAIHGGKKLTVMSRAGNPKTVDLHPFPEGCLIIGELGVGTQEALAERARLGHDFIDLWDILFFDHKYLGDMPLLQRLKLLEVWHGKMWPKARKFYRVLPVWEKDFVKHYEEQLEGLVLKHARNGRYCPGKKVKDWVKCKKEYTYDCIIVGWIKSTADSKQGVPMVESLTLAQFHNGKITEFGRVGNMTNELSLAIAADFDAYAGRVIEIKGYSRTDKGNLRHPSVIRMRDDKDPIECIWDGTKYGGNPL